MKYRILVVDDEADIRTILKGTLSEKYEVVEAHDGLDALEKLERDEPDFICLDIMMPMMDGFDACVAIRKSEKFSSVPVMFLTALGQKENIVKGYGAGANLYLTKPFEPSRLLRNIELHFTSAAQKPRPKRYTLEQLQEMESNGHEPIAPGSGEFEAPDNAAPAQPISQRRILPRAMVVDDDNDVIILVNQTLHGHAEVVSSRDGLDAIEKLVRYQPDLLLLDIMIPRLSGFQLIQSLRQNPAFAKLPILVCSGRTSDRDQQFAMRVGANGFLPKPYRPSDLLERFHEITRNPSFRIRPKSISYEEIANAEAPKEDIFEEETRERKRIEQSRGKIAQILNTDRKEEARKESDMVTKEIERTEKRSIFKFGRK